MCSRGRFSVTAFDLRGHGYSDVPQDGYTSADQASDVLAIMDGLDIEQATLLGHSFGAVIATHAAVLYPGRIDGLVLSDPSFPALAPLGKPQPVGPLAKLSRGSGPSRCHAVR